MTLSNHPETIPASSIRKDGPWHKEVEGIQVIKVQGDFYEMGYQHGVMLKELIPVGPIPYYRTYLERILGNTGLGPIAPLVWPTLQKALGSRIAKQIPDFAIQTMKGMADGAEIPLKQVLGGATMPDALLWVASRFMRYKKIPPALKHRMVLELGCTSAMAWGDATQDGMLLHSRNLDFHGVDCWPKTTTVSFHEPKEGHRYTSCVAAGVPTGGVTSMNSAGLTMVMHQHMFTDRAKMGGVPTAIIGDIIMREASNLEDAERILGEYKPIGCWTYLVSDGKTNEVLCWEENPDRNVAIRIDPESSTFGYTNIYLDKELGDTEIDLYPSYWRHNLGRYQRAEAMLEAGFGTHNPESMAQILADEGETENCRISTAIGMLKTVGSVVFRPQDGAFWVATGEAPTSQAQYIPFDLNTEDHAPQHGTLDTRRSPNGAAPKAFEYYRDAYLAYFDGKDNAGSKTRLKAAVDLQPEQSLYHFIDGLLKLKSREFQEAKLSFETCLELGHLHEERKATFHLWRGRALELCGHRKEALHDYRAILDLEADPVVKKAAEKGLKGKYTARKASRIDIDFTFADVVDP